MKNIQNKLMVLLFLVLAFPKLGTSQGNTTDELHFEVNRIYPYVSIDREALKEVHRLIDINKRFKSSWVRTYLSVEVLTSRNGELQKAVSKSDILSQEQKDAISQADVNTDISVKVRYVPENNLRQNDPKEMNFTFTINPEKDATYIGGQQQLNQYLKQEAIDKISEGSFTGYDFAAVKFTISEDGEITNVHLFESSKEEKIDQLLLKAVSEMPCWEPAKYADGTQVKQEYVLMLGSMENCMTNLLNIQQD